MRKLYIVALLLAITFFQQQTSAQQLRLGNQPYGIEKSAVLELKSDNQGLLFPRIADTALINALTPPDGMVIFHSTSKQLMVRRNGGWLALNSALLTRSNHVIVKSTADLPAASGGVITLLANTTYEINGTITLSSKINLNGSCLIGVNATQDKIIYTGGGELFTGSLGGTLRLLSLTSSSNLFNLNAGGANTNLIFQNCYVLACGGLGTIKGFGGTVFFSTIAYFYNNNGITFENNNNIVLSNQLWDGSNKNTYEKFTGTFNIIQKIGGDMICQSANTAIGMDVSGITNIASGEIKSVLFDGNGTYKTGIFSSNWEVESTGLDTEKDDVATGNLYISTSATTSFSNVNTKVKVAGTTTPSNLFRVTSPANNRLTYTGTKTRRFQVTCAMTAVHGSIFSNKLYTFYIAKNGVVLEESRQRVRLINNSDQASVSLSCTVQLAKNDYIEVWVENNTDNTAVAVQSLNLGIK